jgi:trans-aconitate methyltransferase
MTAPSSSSATEFAALTCSAPEERAARMAELVLRHAPSGPIRLLDLGCGTGGLLFRLASALPEASCVGVDVSVANIAVAEAARRLCPERDRLAFEVVDYLKWNTPPMDLITTDSVLNLIGGDTDSLVAKIANDLRPGGNIIISMPYVCARNTVIACARHVLRASRSSWVDATILAVGRLLHPEVADDLLRERVHYMYLPPTRVMGHRLEAAFSAHGLFPVARYPVKSASIAQLRHSVTVWRKNA